MTTSIVLPESLLDKIKKRAAAESRSVSNMIRVISLKALSA
ncbi:hypothetical protein BMR02_12530 [Methylococcaceae bacterium HT1]|nr:hypothetical protein BMR02_12530 [Methylococcaceae bacterium HT1]TXL21772.1 hypothetical protein BMR03_12090 [Methylococcaceae bacterium HT2]TXL21963.1 hypothetical protein BMR03_10840 [Methylococcaceae bacterium HT2]